MDILIKLLMYGHFLGLVLGMGSGMALSNVKRLMTSPSAGSGYDKLVDTLAKNGHVGLGMLWVTGVLMVWLKHGGVEALDFWFWIKMALVIVLSAAVGIGSASARKARAGDGEAAKRAQLASLVSGLSGIAAIFTAVFAFN